MTLNPFARTAMGEPLLLYSEIRMLARPSLESREALTMYSFLATVSARTSEALQSAHILIVITII